MIVIMIITNDHKVLDDQNDCDYDDHQDAQLADEWFWIVIGGRPTTGHCGEPSHWNLTRGLWKIILIVHNLVIIILIIHNLVIIIVEDHNLVIIIIIHHMWLLKTTRRLLD